MIQILKFKSIRELVSVFKDDRTCHQFMASHRWNTGIVDCPHCSHESCYVFKDGIRYKCKKCRRVFTAITGSYMSGTKLPLTYWIEAMWYILRKKGISSVQLAKDLNITQKTAWHLLHKIRSAMGNEVFHQLEGTVEIDEAFVGGKAKFKHKAKKKKYNPGRNWHDKTAVLGMLQRGGRVRAMIVPNVQMLALKKAVYAHIKGGSTIMGDGFQGYRALVAYDVRCVDHSLGWYVDGETHTNTIEGFWSQLKRGINATYHHVAPKHLNKYLQEFVFKYNYRKLDTQQQIERILWNMKIKVTQKQMIAA